jgi:hypothetical protein
MTIIAFRLGNHTLMRTIPMSPTSTSRSIHFFWTQQMAWSSCFIVVTYFQFDSNIRILYVFLGILKNTWKYLIQRPIFKPLYNYNVLKKILENTSFWAPSKNTRISYVTTMSCL